MGPKFQFLSSNPGLIHGLLGILSLPVWLRHQPFRVGFVPEAGKEKGSLTVLSSFVKQSEKSFVKQISGDYRDAPRVDKKGVDRESSDTRVPKVEPYRAPVNSIE